MQSGRRVARHKPAGNENQQSTKMKSTIMRMSHKLLICTVVMFTALIAGRGVAYGQDGNFQPVVKPASDSDADQYIELLHKDVRSPKLEPFQERLGGRIALAAEIDIAGLSIVTYNLHLESRANDELRLSQLEEVLRDAAAFDAPRPLILSGDLNLNASKLGVTEVLARNGFRDAAPTARVATTPSRHLLEGGRHIDWAFVRGPVEINKARVHNTVKGSDHYPISFDLRISTSDLESFLNSMGTQLRARLKFDL